MVHHILLQKNNSIYLLISYPDRYHIIAANNSLDDEEEEKILQGDCSDARIDKMGLTRITVMKTDLRGVAIEGSCAGDAVVLYTKDKKLRYVLSDDYSEEELENLFVGAKRFQPQKNKKDDWRKALQTQKGHKNAVVVGTVLNAAGVACLFCNLFFSRLQIERFVLSCVVIIITMGVYFVYPQYFSLISQKEYKKAGGNAKLTHLDVAVLGSLLNISFLGFKFPNWGPVLIWGVAVGAVLTVLLYVFAREFRESKLFLVMAALLLMFGSVGLVAQVNHFANNDPGNVHQYTVTEIQKNRSSKRNYYYITVQMPSGEEWEFSVSREKYVQIQTGDQVQVYVGSGALGIEYAYIVE